MDSTRIKNDYAGRRRKTSKRQDVGNMENENHTGGTQARNRLSVYAKVGDKVELVYRNIDSVRLTNHSLLAATMLSNTATNSQVSQALALTINPAEVTKGGLRYVLHAINNTNTDRNIHLNPSKSVTLDIEIWAAVMTLRLATPQGHFRHKLLNRISDIVPDSKILTVCHILHETDKPVYQRLVTRTAECLTNGTIDTVAGQHLLDELFPRLRQNVEKCVRKSKTRLTELAAASKDEYGDNEAVEDELRAISGDEVEKVKSGGRSN